MFVAFPHLYATSFSGFYLALMLVLWLLVLRGLGIEFRHGIDHDMWRQAWDVAFSLSSVLLALLFGVALGNVLRGVPLDARGEFQGTFSLMLNSFAILGGALSVAVLSMHGAAWIVVKTEGAAPGPRAQRYAGALWWVAMVLLAAMIAASFVVRPGLHRQLRRTSVAAPDSRHHGGERSSHQVLSGAAARAGAPSWLAPCSIAGLLASVAAGLYPQLLPAAPEASIRGSTSTTPPHPRAASATALAIYLWGLALVVLYQVSVYRIWRGKSRDVYH